MQRVLGKHGWECIRLELSDAFEFSTLRTLCGVRLKSIGLLENRYYEPLAKIKQTQCIGLLRGTAVAELDPHHF